MKLILFLSIIHWVHMNTIDHPTIHMLKVSSVRLVARTRRVQPHLNARSQEVRWLFIIHRAATSKEYSPKHSQSKHSQWRRLVGMTMHPNATFAFPERWKERHCCAAFVSTVFYHYLSWIVLLESFVHSNTMDSLFVPRNCERESLI
jgi:hypothetical protein